MLLALLMVLSGAPDWVPARWFSPDPKSLELLQDSPINCLLLEKGQWSRELAQKASERGVTTLAVVRPGDGAKQDAREALEARLNGLVLEGDFDPAVTAEIRAAARSGTPIIEMLPRASLRLDQPQTVLATYQGVWPGVHVQDNDGKTHAGPTGSPWIYTNAGFLRFARAATSAPVWLGNLPPEKRAIKVESYLQSIGDAAILGARWVVALEDSFARKLLGGDAQATAGWARINAYLRYFEKHQEWRKWRPYGRLAVVQDAGGGALLSGGILDMIAVKHTPVLPVPKHQLEAARLEGATMAVNVDSEQLSPEEREILRQFARAGGTLLNSPPGSHLSPPKKDQIMLDEAEVSKIDNLWRGVNTMIGRENLGARLFNVSAMLSNLLSADGGKTLALHLVNYSDYPAENITVQFLGKYSKARVITPEGASKELETFATGEGTGVEIDQVPVCATLLME
jgi:hypothetical protein